MSNPLLNVTELPQFNDIKAEHAVAAIDTVIRENKAAIEQLCEIETPTWDNFALIMEDLDEKLGRVWSPIGHLNGVKDSDDLRDAYQTCLSLLTDYHTEVGQNQALYQQYKTLADSSSFEHLNTAQQKVIENTLRDFRLSGAELDNNDKQRFKAISKQLSELGNQFSQNVLDATQNWTCHIDDKARLSGLPDSAIKMAEQLAQQAELEGWLFNLQIPSYLAVMQYADDAQLRKEMYYAYATRASDQGPDAGQFDNNTLIDEILSLRLEKAKLLGFANYAELSLSTKMAGSPDRVVDFLQQLTDYARPVAEKELAELRDFAQQQFQVSEFEAWDVSYYSEKYREHLFSFTDEEVKPYFPAAQVFSGMFEIVSRLFNIHIGINDTLQTWHEDVQCFDVFDANARLIGQFYADLYARQHKRGGAWMDTCVHHRYRHGKTQKPVAYLTCNFTPPIGDDPALLTHNEVETLFHEFGHTLHHLLTKVEELSVAGINGVQWDAVELPSQFLENWCWQEDSLSLIAKHYKTAEALPEELLAKMRAAKNFQSGMQTVRQIEFALFDMRLHSEDSETDVQTLLNEVRQQVAVIQPPAYHRFQNSFSHIFAGGYAAGYYSYKWSEVLSADAFSRFEEEGIFNADTGRDFLESILQQGGVRDANQLFKQFRDREPDIKPLLRHTGILQQSAV